MKRQELIRTIFVWIAASLVCGGRGLALDPARSITQYTHAVWQDRDGLPQNTVQAIVQTRDGYLWLGTEAGLARFDGARFVVFDQSNTPELRHSNVTALCEGRDGSLWIGTRGGGVVRFRGGKFAVFTRADGLAHDSAAGRAAALPA